MRAGDDSVLTLNEIASCMITLLVAGHETTTAQINNALLHLLTEREHWRALCAAPGDIPRALEEMMRYDPSVCAWRRLAAKASAINGVDIPAGANLLLMLHSANRDERVFPEPDEIIFERGNLKDQLAFGYGIHYCVGAPLARLEMAILLETLNARAAGACGWWTGQALEYTRNISFRGPECAGCAFQDLVIRHNSQAWHPNLQSGQCRDCGIPNRPQAKRCPQNLP